MFERPQKHRGFADPAEHGALPGGGCRPLPSSPPPPDALLSSAAAAGGGDGNGNVDQVLFKNLVEMVPLVESLMDRRSSSCFTRRASMVYTPAPTQLKKVTDPVGVKTALSAKKRRDLGESVQRNNRNGAAKDGPKFSSRIVSVENVQKEREELTVLREQINDLQKKLLEKDEALKYAENSSNQINTAHETLDELKRQVNEKDSLVRSTNSELYNAKILLADKQAALEKLHWEAKMSNRKVEELQGDVISMDLEITTLMQLFDKLSKNDNGDYPDDSITSFHFDPLPPLDNVDEIGMETMEEARAAYIAAVAAAKKNPNDESLAAASEARLRLRALVL